jgi:RNA-directed DNA polymerase
MTGHVFAVAMARLEVNGPEDQRCEQDVSEWETINWRSCEEQVRRLRQRIFKATREGDWPKVRNLQKLMLRSRANTLVGVRQVAQRNTGRKTAGIDGEVALTSQARAELAVRVHGSRMSWRPRAVKRVYIPKAGSKTKLRPLGIPVLMDRCHQARVRNALEPEWEARFEPRSYGFRPGRGCHDAIASIFQTLCRKTGTREWIVDADLASAFDRIDHDRLLAMIGDFPARGVIADWLKAGVFEPGKGFAATEEGTPQGGVISPLLLNIALHGLEEAAGVQYFLTGSRAGQPRPGSPVVVRYADLCRIRHKSAYADRRIMPTAA